MSLSVLGDIPFEVVKAKRVNDDILESSIYKAKAGSCVQKRVRLLSVQDTMELSIEAVAGIRVEGALGLEHEGVGLRIVESDEVVTALTDLRRIPCSLSTSMFA